MPDLSPQEEDCISRVLRGEILSQGLCCVGCGLDVDRLLLGPRTYFCGVLLLEYHMVGLSRCRCSEDEEFPSSSNSRMC